MRLTATEHVSPWPGTRGVSLWQLAARQVEPVRSGVISSAALSRSGALLAYAADGEVVVWDTKQARRTSQYRSTSMQPCLWHSVRTRGRSQSVRRPRSFVSSTLRAARSSVDRSCPSEDLSPGLTSAPTGATLATATQGGVITLWDDMLWSDVESMQRRLCDVAGESMTKEQWREFIPGRDYRETCP